MPQFNCQIQDVNKAKHLHKVFQTQETTTCRPLSLTTLPTCRRYSDQFSGEHTSAPCMLHFIFTQAHHVQDGMRVFYFECDVHSVNKFHLAVLVSGMKGGPARWKWRRVLFTPVT